MARVVRLGCLEAAHAQRDFRRIENRAASLHMILEPPVVAVAGAEAQRIFEHGQDIQPVRQNPHAKRGLRGMADKVSGVRRVMRQWIEIRVVFRHRVPLVSR